MIDVFGYIRVSTLGQVKKGYSLGEQRDEIEKYCLDNGYRLDEIFKDEGKSGAAEEDLSKLYKRDGLLAMFDKLEENNNIKFVIVLSTNRLWRDGDSGYTIKKMFRKYGVDVKAIDRPNYSIYKSENPNENLVNGMLELLDTYEREDIALKLKRGRNKKASNGGYSGGGAPYGYKAMKGSKELSMDQGEAQAVQRVFELKANDSKMTLQKIADTMNHEGFKGRKEKAFSIMLVKRILDREEFYRGVYEYSNIKTDGKHQPILR